jgi:hypothetical protein
VVPRAAIPGHAATRFAEPRAARAAFADVRPAADTCVQVRLRRENQSCVPSQIAAAVSAAPPSAQSRGCA